MLRRKKLSLLTTPEIECIEKVANFTDLQRDIFHMLCKDKSTVYITVQLCISQRTFFKEKDIIYDKIKRATDLLT